jgi:tetratricopeptide (TPR) repeat protein
MDEQRFEANLNLIQQLLECPNGEEGDIINAHRELVDADLLQVMEEKATDMAENGKSNAAEFLQNLVAHLANSIGNTVTSKEYLDFLIDVLNTTSDCRANPQVIYPILQQNLDKLTLRLAEILQDWTTSNLAEVDSEQKEFIAADIGSFGSLIRQFPQGRRAWNLEISIACYTAALEVFTRQDYPQQWAMTKHNLGMVYRNRIEGVMAANIELAIASFTEALETYTDKNYPEEWQ